MKKLFIVALMFLYCNLLAQSQEIIRLYDGIAPGSEKWNWKEFEYPSETKSQNVVHNVVIPTLSIYLPEKQIANGAALVICAGGGFTGLWLKYEGLAVKDWCLKHGIVAAILKYRLNYVNPKHPNKNSKTHNPDIIKFACNDGRRSIELLRENASKYNIRQDKIGIIGFSAGARIALDVAVNHTEKEKPNLAAVIYGFSDEMIKAPDDAAPMFICSPEFDLDSIRSNNYSTSLNIYKAWRVAHIPCDIHIFNDANHGFGMKKFDKEIDIWPDNLLNFVRSVNFIPGR